MQIKDNTHTLHSPAQAMRSSGYTWRGVDDVLGDRSLDAQQKRAILSSWASDLFAVDSCPWLRQVPGIASPLRVADIFAALRSLDGDPPPRGGASVRPLPAVRRWTDARMRVRSRPAELKYAG